MKCLMYYSIYTVWANTTFSERHPEIVKNASFSSKPQLFDLTLCRQQNVLAWKMIARHHDPVHGSGALDRLDSSPRPSGSRAFLRLRFFPAPK
jgi:hypothetical protein